LRNNPPPPPPPPPPPIMEYHAIAFLSFFNWALCPKVFFCPKPRFFPWTLVPESLTFLLQVLSTDPHPLASNVSLRPTYSFCGLPTRRFFFYFLNSPISFFAPFFPSVSLSWSSGLYRAVPFFFQAMGTFVPHDGWFFFLSCRSPLPLPLPPIIPVFGAFDLSLNLLSFYWLAPNPVVLLSDVVVTPPLVFSAQNLVFMGVFGILLLNSSVSPGHQWIFSLLWESLFAEPVGTTE